MVIKKLLNNAVISRLLILAMDLLVSLIAFFVAVLLRFNFVLPDYVLNVLPQTFLMLIVFRLLPFYFLKTYSGIIKYTGEEDAKNTVFAVSIGSAMLLVFNKIIDPLLISTGQIKWFFFPLSVILIDFVLTSFLLVFYKVSVKVITQEVRLGRKNISQPKRNVAIFGAGKAGLITKQAIERSPVKTMNVVAFFDDDLAICGKSIDGLRIYHTTTDFEEVSKKYLLDTVIISVQNLSADRKEKLVDICLEHDISLMTVPPMDFWNRGNLDLGQIKDFKIEDLLNRDPIQLDNKFLRNQLKDKVILVTGAAGSIGSELVRQIARYDPKLLLMVDVAETPLVDLSLEIEESYADLKHIAVLADVSNPVRMELIFSQYKPELVFHAAAYKHVPAMESSPSEAVRVNVKGTKILADLSTAYRVDKFVMISTDKAVNPTNVMGCSKRVAEIYTQSLNNHNIELGKNTRFITTRFGNVLGSNGSVIPRFRKQLAAGGPLTVTHPEITRYFMTIPEACQLVLEASAMGNGGEIYVFDMGKSVKILDLAEKMIKLAGRVPYKDIDIVFTGLRPGEKLKEELLSNDENTIPTHHNKIMIGKVREYNFKHIEKKIEELIAAEQNPDDFEIVKKMKQLVPEFISNNSVFAALDAPQVDNVPMVKEAPSKV
jgi:FlaA1/EpsC-like NDP-sugar epimerase